MKSGKSPEKWLENGAHDFAAMIIVKANSFSKMIHAW